MRCAWCAKGRATHEHQRPDRLADLGHRWWPACAVCHRWLTGARGDAGRMTAMTWRPLEAEGEAA